MKKQSSINIKLAMAFGIIIVITVGSIGTSSAFAQTNTSSSTTGNTSGTTTGNATTNGNQSDTGTASEITRLTKDNTGDTGSPNSGLTQGMEKEQTSDTAGNMTTADNTAGQNATTTGGTNTTTTTANNSSTNGESSQNKTGNPLSNVPVIGGLFK